MARDGEHNRGDKPLVLVIDDEPSLLRYFEYNLGRLGYRVAGGRSAADMFALLEREAPAVLLLDLMLPDGEALEFLPRIRRDWPRASVVLISAHGTIPKAVSAIQGGAVNFLQKPVSPEQLDSVIAQAFEMWRLRRELHELKSRVDPASEFHCMIGQSEVMQGVYRLIESVAVTSTPVLISGESGTGKELVARALHELSPRREKPFIAINCAAIPHDLLESEIFGHEKGAFTGAIEQYRGCFERAHDGVLFLDEICEMDLGLQAKLLRLIQEQNFFRIGGSVQISVNVRIVAATNRDPLKMVREGRFREDLYYRLNVLPIRLPPLRERREDIGLLATRLLQRAARAAGRGFQSIELEAMMMLERHPWSGNVRELNNVIEQVLVLHDGEVLTRDMLPDSVRDPDPPDIPSGGGAHGATGGKAVRRATPGDLRPIWEIERDEIQRALIVCGGNVQEVSRRLELSPATLYRKIEKYGLVK